MSAVDTPWWDGSDTALRRRVTERLDLSDSEARLVAALLAAAARSDSDDSELGGILPLRPEWLERVVCCRGVDERS